MAKVIDFQTKREIKNQLRLSHLKTAQLNAVKADSHLMSIFLKINHEPLKLVNS